MELEEVISVIRAALSDSDFSKTKHFIEKCEERNLDVPGVQLLLAEHKLLGVVEQNDGLYKLWFAYKKSKDLNLVIKILPQQRLKLITVFPCSTDKRER